MKKAYVVYNLDCEGKAVVGTAGYIVTDKTDVENEYADNNDSLPSFLLKASETSTETIRSERDRLAKLLAQLDACLDDLDTY